MLTLYQYLHCPYCVRADMVANYMDVEHKKVYLLNDDEETCFRLIDAKMVPILEFDDGSAMGESLDIAKKFEELGAAGKKMLPANEYERYTSALDAVYDDISALLYPRNIMIEQPEFNTQSAKDYFQKKKEKSLGMSFEDAMNNTDKHRKAVEEALGSMPVPPLPRQQMNQLGWNDVHLFPTLRNLTMVKDLAIPSELEQYIGNVASLTKVKLYTDVAV
ncbi:glutaredoxin 2 [Alteromonas pelagimontana]|uniref:Glutaredoxin 2 n=1 Tax=Alteromonas pelagimontana TaxID=1858656 RepID=A0A6M4MEE3_9ALTE|nr:glutaredoxin 2 [Alteromonas pelagimontana]QJR81561.1 glutaredoxin 2 [Alteromonas pelagimontana]